MKKQKECRIYEETIETVLLLLCTFWFSAALCCLSYFITENITISLLIFVVLNLSATMAVTPSLNDTKVDSEKKEENQEIKTTENQ